MLENDTLSDNPTSKDYELFSYLTEGNFEAFLSEEELAGFNRFVNSQVAFTGGFIFVVGDAPQPTWFLFTVSTVESLEEGQIVFKDPDFLLPFEDGLEQDLLNLPRYIYRRTLS